MTSKKWKWKRKKAQPKPQPPIPQPPKERAIQDLARRLFLADKAETMQEALEMAAGIEAWFEVWPWCRPKTPYPWTPPLEGDPTRQLTADGRIIIRPWTNDLVESTLLRAMPGCIYNPVTKEWQVSLKEEDEEQVIRLAWRLALTIHPDFPKRLT